MDKPLVSAIIPLYNGSNWIERAVKSVENQEYGNLELLILDDASTDDSLEIVKSLDISTKLRIIEHEKNRGLPKTRNHGVRKSKGKYISILDQDDFWYPDKITKQVDYLQANSTKGIVLTNFHHINATGEKIGKRNFNENLEEMEKEELVSYFFNKAWKYDHPPLPLTSSLIRKEVFRKIGYYNTNLPVAHDREFMMRAFQKYGIKVLKDNLMAKRYHQTNISGSGNWRESIKDREKITEKMIDLYPFLEKYRPQREAHTELSKTYSLLGEGKIVPASVAWMKALHRSPSLTLSKTFNYVRKKF